MNGTATNLIRKTVNTTTGVGGRRWSGVALLAGALLSVAACAAEPSTRAATVTAPTPESSVPASSVPTSSLPTSSVPATSVAATTTIPAIARPTAAFDDLVGDPGNRIHVRCVGQGDTTVMLIAGFGGDTTAWTKVEPVVAAQARVCSYDRPGTGTSDPPAPTSRATFTTQATQLHTLLEATGEPGPYVVVGHSFGGATAVEFASLYADEVTGVVLVDASPTTWPAELCAVPADGSDGAAIVQAVCSTFPATENSEHVDVEAAFLGTSRIDSLGTLPIAVITATERDLPADLSTTEVARLDDVWHRGQQAWVALSPAAHLVSVDDTSHDIQIDQPTVVVDEITRLLP